MDLKEASASIERSKFLGYLQALNVNEYVVNLLSKLINGWDDNGKGLPLVNDSMFFLGSDYINTIDPLLRKYTKNFIRYVDDYRVFGNSLTTLEKIHEGFKKELESTEFSLNERKTRLGANVDYFKAIKKIKRPGEESLYFAQRVYKDVIDPKQLFLLVNTAIRDPERYLTVRFGRLIIGEIQRIKHSEKLKNEFRSLLSKNDFIKKKIIEMIRDYAKKRNEEWRLIWLLNLIDFIGETSSLDNLDGKRAVLKDIRANENITLIVRLWASKVLTYERRVWISLLNANYLEVGKTLYGESNG